MTGLHALLERRAPDRPPRTHAAEAAAWGTPARGESSDGQQTRHGEGGGHGEESNTRAEQGLRRSRRAFALRDLSVPSHRAEDGGAPGREPRATGEPHVRGGPDR